MESALKNEHKPAATQRLPKWDNVKGLLILCVVIAHMFNGYREDSEHVRSLYFFIYSFHMPAFVFVSGLFSKKAIDNKQYDKPFYFLVMYFVTQFIVRGTYILIGNSDSFTLFSEGGVPWYAFAMFAFYLVTMFVNRFDPKWVFLAAVVLGCMSGYDDSIGNFLCLSRLFAFYPFFLLGYYMDRDRLSAFLDKKIVRIVCALFILAVAVFLLFKVDDVWWLIKILKGKHNYSEIARYNIYGGVLRLLWYIYSFIFTFCVIAITPKFKNPLTLLGERSLQIYVLHYAVYAVLFSGLGYKAFLKDLWPSGHLLLVLLTGVVITFVLAAKPFTWITKKLIYPPRRQRSSDKNA